MYQVRGSSTQGKKTVSQNVGLERSSVFRTELTGPVCPDMYPEVREEAETSSSVSTKVGGPRGTSGHEKEPKDTKDIREKPDSVRGPIHPVGEAHSGIQERRGTSEVGTRTKRHRVDSRWDPVPTSITPSPVPRRPVRLDRGGVLRTGSDRVDTSITDTEPSRGPGRTVRVDGLNDVLTRPPPTPQTRLI